MKSGEKSSSVLSRDASLKCSGKERGLDLQVLTAQVRKFVVKIFILTEGSCDTEVVWYEAV